MFLPNLTQDVIFYLLLHLSLLHKHCKASTWLARPAFASIYLLTVAPLLELVCLWCLFLCG